MMKIKLAILEKDPNYLNKISSAFGMKYGDKIEVYSFTDPDLALSVLEDRNIDLMMADSSFEIVQGDVPRRCGLGYFVESADIEEINGIPVVFKYQKIELIFKMILSIYATVAENISGIKFGNEMCRMIVFASPSGGVGTSTMAAACALHFALQGKNTLFLSFERFGSSEMYFHADGKFDMSDVIFDIKSGKANLPLRLESSVRQDASGVYFYATTKNSLDMMELKQEEIEKLITTIQVTGKYDFIVIDTDFSVSNDAMKLYKIANGIVIVSDGSVVANAKIENAYQAVSVIEGNADAPIMKRMRFMYNKFSSKTGKVLEIQDVGNSGGFPVFVGAGVQDILLQMRKSDYFDALLN